MPSTLSSIQRCISGCSVQRTYSPSAFQVSAPPQLRVCDEHGVVLGEFLPRVEKSVGLEAVGAGDLGGFQVRFGQSFDAPRGEFGNRIGTRERNEGFRHH